MFKASQKLFQQVFIFFLAASAFGQEKWPSPEIQQMYNNACGYMALANYKDAIITYKQAILLAPGMSILYKGLGNAYYLSGNYHEAEQTLSDLAAKHEADTQCYRLLAASQAAQKEIKKAQSTIQQGLEHFPKSGTLYYETGIIYSLEHKDEDALNAWLDGIQKEPGFPNNYLMAAQTYLGADKVTWGLLYGETYLDMPHDTTGDADLKNKLFASWKKMFDNIASDGDIKSRASHNNEPADNFEAALRKTYTLLTPVVSDGVTAENLVMVRTRFLMDWFAGNSNKYPFPLFSYMQDMVSDGKFDIYNEWLFGNAENREQYTAWNTFHEGDMARFEAWKAIHPLHPAADAYNTRNMEGIFHHSKRKK